MPLKILSDPRITEIQRAIQRRNGFSLSQIAAYFKVPKTAIQRLAKQMEKEGLTIAGGGRQPRGPLLEQNREKIRWKTSPGPWGIGKSTGYRPLWVTTTTGGTATVHIIQSIYEEVRQYAWVQVLLKKAADWGPNPRLKVLAWWTHKGPDGKGRSLQDLIVHIRHERGEQVTGQEIKAKDPF